MLNALDALLVQEKGLVPAGLLPEEKAEGAKEERHSQAVSLPFEVENDALDPQ